MHKCSDVDKVADSFRDEIDVLIAGIVEGSNEGLNRKIKLEEVKGKLLEELKTAEDAVKEKVKELKQLIEKHAKILLDELVRINATRMKETENEFDNIERHLAMLNSFNAYCSEMRSKGTPVDICRSVDDLRSRANELQEVNASKKDPDVIFVEVCFKSSSIEDMLKTQNIVGSLEVKKTGQRPLVSADAIKVLQCSSNVEAMTKLDDTINVLCKENVQSGITIYIFDDRDPCKNYKKVQIEDIKGYIRVASSEKFRCVYILDISNSCIWRLMADDSNVTKWLSNLGELIALSASNDGLILLRDYNGSKTLETYGPDAEISRSISLSSDIVNPVNFVQEANGKFVIIHRSESSGGSRVVSEVSNEGQFLRQFKSLNPFYPTNLWLDSDSDRLIVAQTVDIKLSLVIFDLEFLEWQQTLLIYEYPFDLYSAHYDERTKEFLVSRSDGVAVHQIH